MRWSRDPVSNQLPLRFHLTLITAALWAWLWNRIINNYGIQSWETPKYRWFLKNQATQKQWWLSCSTILTLYKHFARPWDPITLLVVDCPCFQMQWDSSADASLQSSHQLHDLHECYLTTYTSHCLSLFTVTHTHVTTPTPTHRHTHTHLHVHVTTPTHSHTHNHTHTSEDKLFWAKNEVKDTNSAINRASSQLRIGRRETMNVHMSWRGGQ